MFIYLNSINRSVVLMYSVSRLRSVTETSSMIVVAILGVILSLYGDQNAMV